MSLGRRFTLNLATITNLSLHYLSYEILVKLDRTIKRLKELPREGSADSGIIFKEGPR